MKWMNEWMNEWPELELKFLQLSVYIILDYYDYNW